MHAILLGAGKGERFGSQKLLAEVLGRTVIERVIDVFEGCEIVDSIVLVISKEVENFVEKLIEMNSYKKVRKILIGGKTRRESSYIGISNLEAKDDDVVLIHDAARPLVGCDLIKRVVKLAEKHSAVVPVVRSTDTVSLIGEDDSIVELLPRIHLRRHQTPQAFKYSLIKKAHELALNDEIDENITDDAGLVLKYGISKVYTAEGDVHNVKITYPIDLKIVAEILKEREMR